MDNIHTKSEGFDEPADKKLNEELKLAMREHIHMTLAELDAGSLHGVVIIRVNEKHQAAGSMALCNKAASQVIEKMQEIAADLVIVDAPQEVKSLLELLSRLGARKG